MDKNYESAAKAIGVAPQNPESYPPSGKPRWTQQTNVPTLPDDYTSDQQNIIQGRASCGEKAPNAFRGNP